MTATIPDKFASSTGTRRRFGAVDIFENLSAGVLLIALLGLVGLPMAFIVISAFLEDPFSIAEGFNLDNLTRVYTSSRIWFSALQTLLMSVAVGAISTILGGVLAWILTRFRLPASGFWETVCVVPLFLSPLVGAIAWVALASPSSGILNDLMNMIGAPDWLHFNVMSLPGICMVMVFHYAPYGFLFLSSTLRNTDAAMEEASYMAGRGVLSTALRIVLPLLRASSLSSFLFISILASGEFSVAAILGANGTYTPLSVHLYEAVFGFPSNYGRAAGIATMMIIASMTAFYFYRRTLRDSRRAITVSGRGFATRQMDPGPWKGPILALFSLFGFVTIVLPYLALLLISFTRFRTGDLGDVIFTIENFERIWNAAGSQRALVNTLIVAFLVPAICVAIGVLIVYAHDRLKLKGSTLATYIATSPLAVSHIVLATGFLVIYIHTPLYATLWVIVLALVATYIAHSMRIAGNGLSQLDPALEEAAQINGASRLHVLRSVVIPLMRPSIFSAFVLIFVFAVREVNTAVMLYSPSSIVLAVLSWNYMAEGMLAPAAVVGLVQTILMVLGIMLARIFLGTQSTQNLM